MKKIYISLFLFAFIGFNGVAQGTSKSRKEKQGDKYAFVYSYDKAIDAYNNSKNLSVEGKRNLAKSYYNLDQFFNAEEAYIDLLRDTSGIVANDYYNYAMTLKANGKNSEAYAQMEKYVKLNPEASSSRSFIKHRNNLGYLQADSKKYQVESLNLNSDAQDFGTCFFKEKVVFASSRVVTTTDDDKFNWNNKPFLDIYISEVNGSQLTSPEIFYQGMNTKRHDGTSSFAKDGTLMAYTSNGKKDSDKKNVVGLQIWFSTFENDNWTDPVAFALNDESYSVGQPCLSADGKTMYFTSDMPGGYGKADIYKTTKDSSDKWTKPYNMGSKVNTDKDEMFPFLAEKNEILLFASNGHFGLGGLDIFMVATSGTVLGSIYNAGVPLNSQYDDFAVIVNDGTNKGYFSSDRIGGKGDDDLYSVAFLKGLNAGNKIIGLAKDNEQNILPNTFISLQNENGIVQDSSITGEDGSYFFFTDSNKNFKLKGEKDTYTDGTTNVNTSGTEFEVKADVILTMPAPPKKEEVKEELVKEDIYDLNARAVIPQANNIYFDLNKSNIRPDAEKELDRIVDILNANPNMKIEIAAYSDCRSSGEYNQKLSEMRAKSSANYVHKRISGKNRVSAKGYGETNLVSNCPCEGDQVSNCSEDEHQMNRRTEFIILKK